MEYQNELDHARSQRVANKKWLKKFAKDRGKNLDNRFHEAHEVVFDEFDCLTCANCCKTTSPLFIMSDIERIARHLGLKPQEFMDRYIQIDDTGDYVLQTAPCPFLESDNTCSIYTVRPRACREYPHTNRKRINQILDLTLKNSLICPAVNRIFDFLKD